MFYSLIPPFVAFNRARFVHALLVTTGLALSSSLTSVSATQVATNKFVFDRAPRLVDVSTTQPIAFANHGTYQFTLVVPQDAGAPLEAVRISQAANALQIQFALDQSQVVANGATVPIAAIGGANSDDTTITFARPIQPGSTVTISLLVDRNFGTDGIYLFGVTAYPVGNSTDGLFLGYGRVVLFSQDG